MRAWLNLLCSLPLLLTGCLIGGVRMAASGSPDAAVSTLESEDNLSLAKALAQFSLGLLLVSEEGPDSAAALESFQKAFAADPGNHDLASRVAISALYRKDPQTAVEALERSWHMNPEDYRRTVDLAAIYQTAGRIDDAVVFYRKAIAIEDSPTAVYVALAGLLFLQSQDGESLAALRLGHQKAEEPHLLSIYLFEQARRFISHEDYSKAISCFELLKTWEEVRKPEVHIVLAELFAATDRLADAVVVLQEAMALPDPPPEVFTALAIAMLQSGAPAQAEEVLKTASDRFADSPDVLFMIAGIYNELGKYEQTIALLHSTRAKIEATDSPTLLPDFYFLHLGAAYERLGKTDDASAVFEECLNAYPDSHRVLNYLAYLWAEQNQHLDKALKHSVRSLTLEPNNGAYMDTLGWIYFRMKQYELALETVTKAHLLTGDDAEILLHLGDIQAALGNMEEAVAFWKKSVAIDPSTSNRAVKQLILHGTR